jgi:putative oxidoreductase
MDTFLNLAARVLMSQIFLISGVGKIAGYAATQAYMARMGVPGALLPLVILTEVGGGLALLFGFKTRWAALALAGFTLLAGLIFHLDLKDQGQMISLMKNLAIAGGLLMFVRYDAAGPGIGARA